MTPQLVLTIPGPPVPKQRPRFVRRKDGSGGIYTHTAKKTRDFEKRVQQVALQAMLDWKCGTDDVWPGHKKFSVSCFFYLPDHRTRDLDNLIKSCLDGINGIVFDDDRQIDELYAIREIDRDNPRAIVTVRVM